MRTLQDKVLLSDSDCNLVKELYQNKLTRIENKTRAHYKYNEFDSDTWLHRKIQSLVNDNLGNDYALVERVTVLKYKVGDYFGEHSDGPWNLKFSPGLTNSHFYAGIELSDKEDFTGGEFYIEGKDVEFLKGRMFTHGFDDTHGVKPVTDGTRWSVHFIIDNADRSTLPDHIDL